LLSLLPQRRYPIRYRLFHNGGCNNICQQVKGIAIQGGATARKRKSGYDLGARYCPECEKGFRKEEWGVFPNPNRCFCCNKHLRTTRRNKLRREVKRI